MSFFNETTAALAAGRKVSLAILAKLDFAEGVHRYWIGGFGSIIVDGETWTGTGKLVGISAIATGEANDTADKLILTLSGVDASLLAIARQARSVRGRTVTLYGRFRDPDTKALLDSSWVIPAPNIMDAIGYTAEGNTQRAISLSVETIWTARDTASNGFFSDRDQKDRFPDDRFLEFVHKMKNKKTTWPKYTAD